MRLDVRAAARMFLLAVVVPMSGIRSEEPVRPSVRPLAVSAEARAAMTRYGLEAFGNGDAKNPLHALLYTPKARVGRPLPMVVYISGNGELGDVARQFRQSAIFERVTSAAFQEEVREVRGSATVNFD